MNRLKTGILIIYLVLIGCGQPKVVPQDPRSGSRAFGDTTKVYSDIKVSDVKQKIDRGEDIVLRDVRTDKEFNSGHLKNAVHIPITRLKERINELDKEKKLLFTATAESEVVPGVISLSPKASRRSETWRREFRDGNMRLPSRLSSFL